MEGIEFIDLRSSGVGLLKAPKIFKNALTFDPFESMQFQIHSLIELIRFRHHFKDCDLVLVEGALIPFGIILPKMLKRKIILDTHCVNKLLASHFKKRNFWAYFTRRIIWDLLERFATSLSDATIVVSEREKDFVRTEYKIPESRIFVVPNVVEIQREDCSKELLATLSKKWGLEKRTVVCFVGDLASVQNKDAAQYIIDSLAPFFWKKRKDVVFLIIGNGREDFICNLPNVVFTGFRTDLALFLQLADVCIAPLRVGSGVKTKVLEYLAHGKPVVTTPQGIEGINAEEPNAIIVSEIATFAQTLLETVQILGQLRKTAVRNKRIVERHNSLWSFQASLERCMDALTKVI